LLGEFCAGLEEDVRLRLGRAGVSAASGLAPDLMASNGTTAAVSSGHIIVPSESFAVVGDVVWPFPVTASVVGEVMAQ
jgi:hypothetical protein